MDAIRLVPKGNGDASTPEHMLLRFALSTGLLLAASLSQYLFMWAFWQRRIKDRVWQFVDLLAVTNISCILLEEKHFGFYLHGRSAHDHADADMAQLNANLKLEVLNTALFEWKPSSALHARAHPGARPRFPTGREPRHDAWLHAGLERTNVCIYEIYLSRRVPPCMHVLTTAPSLPHRYTYLFVRMLRNPSLYGASEAERESDPLLEQRRIDLIHSAATLLDKCGLLRY